MNSSARKFVVVPILAVAAILIACEVFFRVFPSARPSHDQEIIESIYAGNGQDAWSVPDTDTGFLAIPFRKQNIETVDYTYLAEGDHFGFPNREPWPQHADVVFLGDSLTTGSGVGIDKQFTTGVAKQLPDYSILNLGLPGAGTEQLRRIYERFAKPLEPKVVVACLYVLSDVDNAKHFDAWEHLGQQWTYERFRNHHYDEVMDARSAGDQPARDEDRSSQDPDTKPGALSLKDRVLKTIVQSAIGEELRYFLLPRRHGWLHEVTWPDRSRVLLALRHQGRLEQGIGSDYPSLSEIFFGPLRQLRNDVEASGAVFLVVLIPSKEEIFTASNGTKLSRLIKEVREGLMQERITTLDLYPPLAATPSAPYFAHDIHLNEAGNRLVAEQITGWLRAQNPALKGPQR